jgi:hypothetical protein
VAVQVAVNVVLGWLLSAALLRAQWEALAS